MSLLIGTTVSRPARNPEDPRVRGTVVALSNEPGSARWWLLVAIVNQHILQAWDASECVLIPVAELDADATVENVS